MYQEHSPVRVAAYCRVSTDHKDQLNSLSSQKNYFTEYINTRKNWILANIFYDEGISGTQTKMRNGFNAMIQAARLGKIDLIVTKEVSRFARNTVDTLSYTRQLKEWGIGVLFILDHIDTRDCDGELRLTLMASIAQEESRKTSERVKWGQTRRMEQGIVFGRDLLGYRVKEGVLYMNEAEADVVRLIFHQYTDEHQSTVMIARNLTEQGFLPKQSTHWSPSVIYRILHNEKYVGDLCRKKTCTPNYLTHKKIINPDKTSQIYLYDHHVPIIDRDLWNRTQQQLKLRSTSAARAVYSTRYWCSGLIQCGLCGRNYVSRTKKRKDHTTYHAWRCIEAASHGRMKQLPDGSVHGCSNISISECALQSCVQYILKDFDCSIDLSNARDQIEYIRIFPDHTLIIQRKKSPWAYHLTIHTQGRLNHYSTEILNCERIESIE